MSTENPAVERPGITAGHADHPDATKAITEAQDRLQQSTTGLPTFLTVDEILGAPSDLKEETIDVPEWGGAIKIRSLTAAQSAAIRQASLDTSNPQKPKILFATLEKAQFKEGVVEPKFQDVQVTMLHQKSGPGFARVIKALDDISGTSKEATQATLESFQTSGTEGQPEQ